MNMVQLVNLVDKDKQMIGLHHRDEIMWLLFLVSPPFHMPDTKGKSYNRHKN